MVSKAEQLKKLQEDSNKNPSLRPLFEALVAASLKYLKVQYELAQKLIKQTTNEEDKTLYQNAQQEFEKAKADLEKSAKKAGIAFPRFTADDVTNL